jgi:hypothetical protein
MGNVVGDALFLWLGSKTVSSPEMKEKHVI